jgi:hypothetical protein
VTIKVRDKRSGLLYVQKTFFHSRGTSRKHSIGHLLNLIARQDSHDASPNMVRCYAAYLVDSDGVRGMFEFCEGGSLRSISQDIRRWGSGVVGEDIAGQIASGVSDH